MTTVNRFFWYELMTTDVPGAVEFYQKVVGWRAHDMGQPGRDYTLLQVGDRGVAGVAELPEQAPTLGRPPLWIGYIYVDNVDAYLAKVQQAGGAVHRPATDIPGIGRFAMVNDPQGAVFMLMTPIGPDRPDVDPGAPGLVGWHELMAIDGGAAFDFYSDLFGWTKSDVYDMGPMGDYQLFATGGEANAGGMMTKPVSMPSPFWSFYFRVDGIGAAIARVTEAGGAIANGPHKVPSDDWIVQGFDPQGAMFSLLSARA